MRCSSILAKEFRKRCLRFADRRRVRGRVRAAARFEMIAEVGARLVAHLLRCGLATVLGNAWVVLNAHAADVQLGPAAAFFQAAQG
jgi:hypothetical protein